MYGKIFEQIYEGSLYGQWEALVTFQQLIVLAEHPDGIVDMTPAAIAARTSIPLDIIQRGIAYLEQPDAESRTPDEEGRRIIRLSDGRTWGWRITNYPEYNAIRTAEERREYMRLYQQARRAAKKAASTDVNIPSTPVSTVNPLAVAVPIATTKKTTTARTAPPSWLGQVCDVYERHYGAGSFNYGKAGKILKPLHEAGFSGEEIASRFDRYANRLDDIRYLSLAKFRESFSAFAENAPNGALQKPKGGVGQRTHDAALRALGGPAEGR